MEDTFPRELEATIACVIAYVPLFALYVLLLRALWPQVVVVAVKVWRVACGVWRVACGVWRVACGRVSHHTTCTY